MILAYRDLLVLFIGFLPKEARRGKNLEYLLFVRVWVSVLTFAAVRTK